MADDLLAEIDRVAAERGYQNRSEAIRDLTRAGLQQTSLAMDPGRDCIAALVYVYDHQARELAKRLTRTFHDHHALSLATLHVHLDQDRCMEVNVLQGRSGDVQHFSEHVLAERGVRDGQVVIIPSHSPQPAPETNKATDQRKTRSPRRIPSATRR
jgi:CopG family nickel-responsive transcriptional regulator